MIKQPSKYPVANLQHVFGEKLLIVPAKAWVEFAGPIIPYQHLPTGLIRQSPLGHHRLLQD